RDHDGRGGGRGRALAYVGQRSDARRVGTDYPVHDRVGAGPGRVMASSVQGQESEQSDRAPPDPRPGPGFLGRGGGAERQQHRFGDVVPHPAEYVEYVMLRSAALPGGLAVVGSRAASCAKRGHLGDERRRRDIRGEGEWLYAVAWVVTHDQRVALLFVDCQVDDGAVRG